MANEDQVKIIKQGKVAWNQWREKNSEAIVDLSGADLKEMDLGGANLTKADLRGANLSEAFLGSVNFAEADLTGAKLNGAFLNEADLSSARGLTQRQINSAKTVDYAKLPGNLKGRQSTAQERAKELDDLLGGGGWTVTLGGQPKKKKWWQFWK